MPRRSPRRLSLLIGIGVVFAGLPAARADFQIIHTYSGSVESSGQFAVVGQTLYGVQRYLPDNVNNGSIFQLNMDGSGYGATYAFQGSPNDGSNAYVGPIVSGSTLYGATSFGGAQGIGTVYSYSLGAGNDQILHYFGGGSDGGAPLGGVIRDGTTLYGMTGALNGAGGTIFKVPTNGDPAGYRILHTFTSSATDGYGPGYGQLLQVGSVLYGMTSGGGSAGKGAIFQINTDGTGFHLLHSFTGGSADGSGPQAGLTLVGSTLFGTTQFGGTHGQGTVFQINVAGNGFQVDHSFGASSPNFDAYWPEGGLVANGATLYGTAHQGGELAGGNLFSIQADGSDYQILHNFSYQTNNGAIPDGGLTLADNTLFGTTYFGGPNSDGIIWSYALPEPSALSILAVAGLGLMRRRR